MSNETRFRLTAIREIEIHGAGPGPNPPPVPGLQITLHAQNPPGPANLFVRAALVVEIPLVDLLPPGRWAFKVVGSEFTADFVEVP